MFDFRYSRTALLSAFGSRVRILEYPRTALIQVVDDNVNAFGDFGVIHSRHRRRSSKSVFGQGRQKSLNVTAWVF